MTRGAPDLRAAATPGLVIRHAALELRLLLRNGEQLLLAAVIPVGLLILLVRAPLPGGGTVAEVLPGVLAISVIAVAFTSLAIATGFERRYDVLRWYGALPLGRPGLLAGKAIATAVLVAAQSVLLIGVGSLLGDLPAVDPVALVVVLTLGTGAFAALGLLLAGLLRPEATLAAANLIWLLLLVAGATVVDSERYPEALRPIVDLLPSAALADGLRAAFAGAGEPTSAAILTAWGLLAAWAASRSFRWN